MVALKEGIPIPLNEESRLSALDSLKILDTAASANFDEITAVAAESYDVPIALVSLVDAKRQWFKSKHGLDAAETSRDISFCTYAIMESDYLLVPDPLDDPRFVNNPLVTGDPQIRFYAGAPLFLTSGIALGSLCIIDRKPRPDITDLSRLKLLAEKTVAAIIDHYEQLENPIINGQQTPPEFKHQAKKKSSKITFYMQGELTSHHADGFYREVLAQVDRTTVKKIILNLSHCEYIDPHGFNTLLQIYQDAEAAGILFCCDAASREIEYLFECMHTEHLLL